MTNEQHIENLKKLKSFHNGSYGESVNAAIKALEELPKRRKEVKRWKTKVLERQKTGHWIPVSERLPEENKTVIASTDYGVYPETKYTKEYGWEWAYESGADYWQELAGVIAWMPLPKPYEPQESEVNNG